MTSVMHKLFFIWQYEAEEKWLNKMAQNGLRLMSVGFCTYVFEKCTKGEYQYHLELLEEGVSSNLSSDYIKFLEETGIEYIGYYGKWAYFGKKVVDGEFELFSDIDSKVAHLKRVLRLNLIIGVLFLLYCIVSIHSTTTASDDSIASIVIAALYFIGALFLLFGVVKTLVRIKKLLKERIYKE